MNRRILGMIGALVLAALGTVMIVAYVNGADARARDGQKTVQVLVVKKSVPPGTPAEQLGDRVASESVVRSDLADGAVRNISELRGKVTGAALVVGEQVVSARFVDASTYRASGNGVEVPSGLFQTTIKLDPERAVGGVLTPGTHVAVTGSFDDKNNWPPASSHIFLDNVLVTNVQVTQTSGSTTNSNSNSDSNSKSNDSAVKPGDAPNGQLLVTLAVDAPSVERLVFTAERGSLWLSIEPDHGSVAGTRIVNRSNVQ